MKYRLNESELSSVFHKCEVRAGQVMQFARYGADFNEIIFHRRKRERNNPTVT
jgi:hypothetical protein